MLQKSTITILLNVEMIAVIPKRINLTNLLLAQPVSSQQDNFHQVNGKQRRKGDTISSPCFFFIKLEMCWLQLSATPFRITLTLSNYGRPITQVTR